MVASPAFRVNPPLFVGSFIPFVQFVLVDPLVIFFREVCFL